jgi:hypothetical protein
MNVAVDDLQLGLGAAVDFLASFDVHGASSSGGLDSFERNITSFGGSPPGPPLALRPTLGKYLIW